MSRKKIDLLKIKQLEFIINSSEYKETLKEVCSDIIQGTSSAENEASVVSIFELELFLLVSSKG